MHPSNHSRQLKHPVLGNGAHSSRGHSTGPATARLPGAPEGRDAGQRSTEVGDSGHRQGGGDGPWAEAEEGGGGGAYPGPRAGPPRCSTGPPAGGSARSGPPAGPCHRTPPGTWPAAPPSSRGPGRQEQRVGGRQGPQTPPDSFLSPGTGLGNEGSARRQICRPHPGRLGSPEAGRSGQAMVILKVTLKQPQEVNTCLKPCGEQGPLPPSLPLPPPVSWNGD